MSRTLDFERIRERLAARRLGATEPEPQASVAAILSREAEILFIRRAEHPGDPWSGHMAFPGGRRDPGDSDLEETARRETREEVGLDLSGSGTTLGALVDLPTFTGGLSVRSHVFAIDGPAELTFNHEVSDAVWVPLSSLQSGRLDTTHAVRWKGQEHRFPAYDVGVGAVWGLTYRMLQTLFDVLRTGGDSR